MNFQNTAGVANLYILFGFVQHAIFSQNQGQVPGLKNAYTINAKEKVNNQKIFIKSSE